MRTETEESGGKEGRAEKDTPPPLPAHPPPLPLPHHPSTSRSLRDDEGSRTESVPNGSSSCINIELDNVTLYDLDPDYLLPPPLIHPLEDNVVATFARGCVYYFAGFLVGLPLLLLLLALTLLILPLRILSFCFTRLSCRGLCSHMLRKRHCDPWWPLYHSSGKESGSDEYSSVVHCVATIQGNVLPNDLQQLLWKKLVGLENGVGLLKFPKYTETMGGNGCGGFCRTWRQDGNFEIGTHVRVLSGEKIGGTWTLRSFEDELNRLGNLSMEPDAPLWSVEMIPEFGESRCTLLVFRVHTLLVDTICIPKMFCLLNDGLLTFDVEPKLRGRVVIPYNSFVSFSYTLWTWCQMMTAGPLSLLLAALRSPEPIWTASQRKTKKKSSKFRSGGSESRHGSRHSSASLLTNPSSNYRRVTWARVPNLDQLLRAERILRASTVELILAFVAGSFRRYFRAQGLRYPTDVQISIPVSGKEFTPVAKHHTCNFSLVPFSLPVSVEGCIPRVWDVQRSLGETLEGAFPLASKLVTTLSDFILPTSWTRRLLMATHRGSGCGMVFVRCSGELVLNSRRIHSILLYQPVPDHMDAVFTFIQNGHEMVVSLMVDQRVFPDPDVLLTGFQSELQGLLRQLSVRLLTLSQATFLPSPLMAKLAHNALAARNADKGSSGSCSSTARQVVETGHEVMETNLDSRHAPDSGNNYSNPEADGSENQEREESLEELEELLKTVQNEIDTLKQNPRANRHDAIHKLSELEAKMEKFHRSIAQRFHNDATLAGKRPSGVDLEGACSVEALLMPYREEAGALAEGGTSSRRDSGFKLKRKRSKRTDSPTRISPKPNREILED